MTNALTAAARVVATAVTDRAGRTGRPDDAARAPGSADAISTAWWTGALCSEAPDATVTSAEVVGGSDGTSARRAVELTYDTEDLRLPRRVFTKTSASLPTRMLLGLTGITQGEAVFFNELRPLVDLRSPRAFHAVADPATCRSVVVLEDLAVEGWTFPDPMRDRVDERDARDMVEQMALYHGAFWGRRTAPAALAKLSSPLAMQERLNRPARFPQRTRTGLERARDFVPPRLWRRRDELWPAVMRALELAGDGPQTLLHQDVHPGNWLRDPEGRKGLYDWQTVACGSWAVDVSYALTIGLEPEDRREWERDLLRHYLAALAEAGAPDPPSEEEAWLAYRRQPMHAYAFCLFTNGQPRFLPELQPADYTLRSIERITIALDDLASLDALAA